MNLYSLKPGDIVRTTEGSLAQVLNPTEDGEWILVRYLPGSANSALVGTEDLCHEDEISKRVETEARAGNE